MNTEVDQRKEHRGCQCSASFHLSSLPKKLGIALIRLYQLCLGPFIGQVCRFTPSCSEYAKEALEKRGLICGSWLTLVRLLKCGPWHPGGHDPVN